MKRFKGIILVVTCYLVTISNGAPVIPEQSEDALLTASKYEANLDELSNSLIEKGTNRLARFIFDYANPSGNSHKSGYGSPSSGSGLDFGKNLLNLNINSNTVTEGIFDPNNIAIHVGQNFFNFAASTIAWGIAGTIYAATNNNAGRSSDIAPSYLPTSGSNLPSYYTHGVGKSLDSTPDFDPSDIISLAQHQQNLESSQSSAASAQRRTLQLEPLSYQDKILRKRHSSNPSSSQLSGIQTQFRSGSDNGGSKIKKLRKVIRKNSSLDNQ